MKGVSTERRLRNVSETIALCLWLACHSSAPVAGDAAERGLKPWDVTDSISLTYIAPDPNHPSVWSENGAGRFVSVSPDGKQFFFVTRRGDLQEDRNVYELNVFSVKAIQTLASARKTQSNVKVPHLTVTMWSTSNIAALSRAQWTSPVSIGIEGVRGDGPAELYRLNTQSGTLTRISSVQELGAGAYLNSVAWNTESAVYTAGVADTRPVTVGEYPASVLGDYDIGALLTNDAFETVMGLFLSRDSARPKRLASIKGAMTGFWPSPDGTKLIIGARVTELGENPLRWGDYGGSSAGGGRNVDEYKSFVLVDLLSGNVSRMLDAPIGVVTEPTPRGGACVLSLSCSAMWFSDSDHVLLVDSALPVSDSDVCRETTSYIVGYTVSTGAWEPLTPISGCDQRGDKRARVTNVAWLRAGTLLLVQRAAAVGEPLPGLQYSIRAGKWVAKQVAAQSTILPPTERPKVLLGGSVRVSVRQGLTVPPVIVAQIGDKEIHLTTEDRAIVGLRISPEKVVSWVDPDGKRVEGGLVEPALTGVSPPPLVIQIGDFINDQFLPDGPMPTAYAAQPLAARGIAVLQMPYKDVSGRSTAREAPQMVARIDAAVAKLVADGAIDPNRVALVGFSRTGWLAYYAATHPGKTKLAAIISADSWTGSFGEYLLRSVFSELVAGTTAEFGREVAGGAFWDHKQQWLENANSFNVDRVEAPVLMSIHGRPALPFAFESIAAFRLANKPLEYLYFPEAAHALVKPRERLASLEATVDWMSYWLQDYRDPAKSKLSQYERWDRMRAQMEVARLHDQYVNGDHTH